jgi:hypothetical protein
MVMPRSRSMALLSITVSTTFSCSAKVPDWRSSWSTMVVLPWSTWAMMAMLRICLVMVFQCARFQVRRALQNLLNFRGLSSRPGNQFARLHMACAQQGARRAVDGDGSWRLARRRDGAGH